MLTLICNYLNNWFSNEKYIGNIHIANGVFYLNSQQINISDGQYFRIVGSLASDAVYKYGTDELEDEDFDGAIWLMRVPPDVVDIAAELKEWMDKYGADSAAYSPFNSETFGGYSYSKGTSASGGAIGWQGVFASRLARYKKL